MNWLYNRITDKELVDNLADSFLIRKEVVYNIVEVIHMKASIPQDYDDAIYDYIIIGLLLETLENKQRKGENVEKAIDHVINELSKVKSYMRKHGIKVHEGEIVNVEFLEFPYTVKVEGGYKEGKNRYWRAAIKMQMNKRLTKMRNKESMLTGDYINGD